MSANECKWTDRKMMALMTIVIAGVSDRELTVMNALDELILEKREGAQNQQERDFWDLLEADCKKVIRAIGAEICEGGV